MLLKLAYYGDPILRKKAKPVKEINDAARQLVNDMVETMHAHNGLGLSATQVSQTVRVFVMCIPKMREDKTWERGDLYICINPKILSVSEEVWVHSEGCLSIPSVYGDVERPYRITLEYQNLDGETVVSEFKDMEARCILHENDHLNGVLFIDRIRGKERKLLEPILQEVKNNFHKS